MPFAPSVAKAFSPLDQQLALSASEYLPSITQLSANLGSQMSFGEAVSVVELVWGVVVSNTSAWRWTTSAGNVQLSIQADELAQLNQDAPERACQPELLQISADGAMIGMRGGGWTEVRTLALLRSGAAVGGR
jgi:hypothetical protein